MNKIVYPFIIISLTIMCFRLKAGDILTPKNAIVQTSYGKVRGYTHNGIYTYKGIPYAQAQRFMPPQKPTGWTGVRNSMAYGPVCPQTGPNVIDQSEFFFHHDFGYPGEDCLRLNIWSTDVNRTKKRPVMVWLHGGGFATGSGNELPSYDGENLCRKGDVVVVGVNHRLNVLGFLNLSSFGEKYKSSANTGMLDLLAALKWVKENIAQFGGDPNNITIFGQSGGGRKVCTLLTMPEAKGLFQKAIVESGASLELFTNKESQRIGELVIKELGLNASSVDSIQKLPYEFIRAAGEKVLMQLNKEYEAQGKSIDGFRLRWGPTNDGDIIPFQPTDDRANAIMKEVPVMIGSTKNEFVQAFNTPDFVKPATEQEAKNILSIKYPNITDEYIKAVKKAYPEAKRPIDLLEVDIRGRASTIHLADLKAKQGKVYTYLFTWESPVLEGRFRSCHCLELPFVFDNVDRCPEMTGGGTDARNLANKMSRAWISFAIYGDPNHSTLTPWEPYTSQNGATMIFDNKCKLVHHHDKELITLVMGDH